jgi:hypothetical protein
MTEELFGVAVVLEPAGIDENPFGQFPLKPV